MPTWWHEITFDLICILNSIASVSALIGVAALRHKMHTLLIGKEEAEHGIS